MDICYPTVPQGSFNQGLNMMRYLMTEKLPHVPPILTRTGQKD